MKDLDYTFKEWQAAIGDVALGWAHMGYKVDERQVGGSFEYNFVYRGSECGSLRITPSVTGADFTFHFPTIEVPASGIYHDPEADAAAWKRKEAIERAVIARVQELFGDKRVEAAKDTLALTERAGGVKREPSHKPMDLDERERKVLLEYLLAIDERRRICQTVLGENGFSSESTFNRLKQRVLEDGTLEQLARQWHAEGKLAETAKRLMEKVRKRKRPKMATPDNQ